MSETQTVHAYLSLKNGETIFIKGKRKPRKFNGIFPDYRSHCAYYYDKEKERLCMPCFPEVYSSTLAKHFIYLGKSNELAFY